MSLEFRLPAPSFPLEILPASVKTIGHFQMTRRGKSIPRRGEVSAEAWQIVLD